MVLNNSPDREVIISVIIASMNCAECLPNALDSLRSQKGDGFECIVIDGGSTDGTVDVIKSNEDLITHWVSEVDAGIADAFNKGVRLAKGSLVYFLGADDVLHDENVFRDVIKALPSLAKPYFFYGDILYSYKKDSKLIRQNFSARKFRKYNCIPHQAMFLDREFFQQYGLFDTDYRYAMDYEHISRFIDFRSPEYINRVIAEMRRYGRSSDVLPVHAEMDRVRLSLGYVSPKRLVLERFILRVKMAAAHLFGLDW
jgi:glycosyltransferase involved in cell wall biosynthesis